MLRYITSDKKRKRDDESTDNSRPTSDTLAKPSKSGRSFSKSWFKTFAWLTYNEDLQMMFCQLCQKHGQKGNFTKGSQNFRKTALTDHAISKEHRDSLESGANSTKDLLINRFEKTRDLTYSDMMKTGVAFTDGLTTQYVTDKPTYGPKLRTFLDATDDSDDYQGVTLTRAYHDKTLTDKARDCVQILVDNVNDRFPDNDKCAAFDIFDPTNFPDNARDLATYGDESISRLGDFYGSRREGRTPIDKDSLEREWGIFRPLVYNKYRRMTYGKLLVKAHESNLSTQFPNVVRVMEIGRVLPVSSVECERGFSKQNLIKTRLRCSLKTETLDRLMRISLCGPALPDFNPRPVLMRWKDRRNRQYYKGKTHVKLVN